MPNFARENIQLLAFLAKKLVLFVLHTSLFCTAHTCPQAVLRAQAKLRQMVPGFTFNAGFVGGYYNSGALMEEVSSVDGGDLPLE